MLSLVNFPILKEGGQNVMEEDNRLQRSIEKSKNEARGGGGHSYLDHLKSMTGGREKQAEVSGFEKPKLGISIIEHDKDGVKIHGFVILEEGK